VLGYTQHLPPVFAGLHRSWHQLQAADYLPLVPAQPVSQAAAVDEASITRNDE